jgi:hypothetical protein
MSNAFTLDDLNQALEKKYGPFVFTAGKQSFTMVQVLRLPKENRDIVRAQLESLETNKDELDESQIFAILKAVLDHVVLDNKSDALVEVLDNDLVKLTILFEKWVESSQVGEA